MGLLRPLLLISACVLLAACARPGDEVRDRPGPEVAYVGDALCRSCHSVEATHWDRTVHARAFKANPRTDLEKHTCEACHGPGGNHVANPVSATIVAFTQGSTQAPEAMNAMCMECHRGGATLYWIGSTHELRGLACSDCHNPMAQTSGQSLLREKNANETCFSCHPAQRADFQKRSHMPLLEGKISCVDCHNPHGSVSAPLLKADDVNSLCTGCHAEKRGPFLWEHAPVRESCLNCHKPHGSNHERLLTTALPFLCQECHSPIDNPNFGHPSGLVTSENMAKGSAPDDRLMNRGCLNCHSQIHGSNSPSGPRFHR
ncbi:MAG TPA: DmsE family decaheme c-type cytochrome [Myxococcota bacterium]|nr:DmsE family decaheme c-type cytochrome [Myxococcota bacterium]